jgi:S1-C subfamily serine protease
VAKNAERALHWTQEAVKQGDAGAQYRLGVFYLEGIGGTRDVVRAFVWFSRAAANERGGGLKAHAAKARDKVAQHLNDKDKARGAALLKQKSTQPKTTPSKPKKQSAGTGFIVSAGGYILTNNHVVAGCREVRIKPLKVPVVAQDPKSDLALLKVSANFKRIGTAPSAKTKAWW